MEKNKGKILITGATGFLGRTLLSKLLEVGYSCRVLVRSESKNKDRFEMLPVEVLEGDFESLINADSTFVGIEAVIHCAALVHQIRDTGYDRLERYREINCNLTLKLATKAVENEVKRFIFISTTKVLKDKTARKGIINEKTIPDSDEPYGISKYEAELELEKLFLKKNTTSCIAIRLPMVYGPENKGNMTALLRIASKKIPLPLAGVKSKRSMIYSKNAADAIATALSGEKESNPFSVYYVTDGKDCTSSLLYNTIFKAMNGRSGVFNVSPTFLEMLSYIFPPFRKYYIRLFQAYCFSNNAFCTNYNWNPPFTLEEGISETVRWFKQSCMKR